MNDHGPHDHHIDDCTRSRISDHLMTQIISNVKALSGLGWAFSVTEVSRDYLLEQGWAMNPGKEFERLLVAIAADTQDREVAGDGVSFSHSVALIPLSASLEALTRAVDMIRDLGMQ